MKVKLPVADLHSHTEFSLSQFLYGPRKLATTGHRGKGVIQNRCKILVDGRATTKKNGILYKEKKIDIKAPANKKGKRGPSITLRDKDYNAVK